MGTYLNSITPYTLYKSESLSPYFVDKTLMLSELFPYVSAGNRHICITRPRRFGKTIMANMISSFFQKAYTCQIFYNPNFLTTNSSINLTVPSIPNAEESIQR